MKFIRQNMQDKCCGQCAVAMVIGKTKEEVVEMFGKTGISYTKQYREVLSQYGYKNTRFKPLKKSGPPAFCLMRVKWDSGNRHIVVHKSGTVYDPAYGVMSFDRYVEFISGAGRVVSTYKLKK